MTQTVTEPTFLVRLRAANREDMSLMLTRATEDEAREAVNALSIRELYELPREIVESWEADRTNPDKVVLIPGSARFIRAERLTHESWADGNPTRMWRIADIARAANVRPDSVGRWRTNTNNGVKDWTKCLPVHDDSIGDVKQPGERKGEKGGGGIPLFEPSTILDWLKRSRKINDDLYPWGDRSRGGGIPPGRPPRVAPGE